MRKYRMQEEILDFKEQTPDMYIGWERKDFSLEEKGISYKNLQGSEFTQDTTAWD